MGAAERAYKLAEAVIAEALDDGGLGLAFSGEEFHALDQLPSKIGGLRALQMLDLKNTRIADLTPIAHLTELLELELDNTQVNDLAPLANLTGLHSLSLTRTPITDLAPLAALNALQYLYVDGTRVSDLTPLAGLTQLRSLKLNQTSITDVAPLAMLHDLRMLDLSNTEISDLAPLTGLAALRQLCLNGTNVVDLRPTTHLDDLSPTTINFMHSQSASHVGGLSFTSAAATRRDAELAKLARLEDDTRTRETLAYLRSLPPWPATYTPAATPDGSPPQPIWGVAEPPKVKASKAQIAHLLKTPMVTRLTAQQFASQIRAALHDVPATNGNYLPEPLQTMLEFADALDHLAPASVPVDDPLDRAKLELRIAQLETLVTRLTQQLQDETKSREAAEALAGKGLFARNVKIGAGLATGAAAVSVVTVGVPTAAVYFLGIEHPLVQAFLTVLGRLPKS